MPKATCSKCNCNDPAEHSLQMRDGDKPKLQVVKLCQEHWEELRLFLGL